jgi:hypothetical protein
MLFAYLKKKISVITKKIKKKNPQKYLLYLINQFIKLIITWLKLKNSSSWHIQIFKII